MIPAEQYAKLRQANRARYGTPETVPQKPTVHPHDTTVTLIDYGIANPCVLDSGAFMTTVPADSLTIDNVLFAHVLCWLPVTEKETTMPRTRTEPTIPSAHEALAAREAIRILDAQADGEPLRVQMLGRRARVVSGCRNKVS